MGKKRVIQKKPSREEEECIDYELDEKQDWSKIFRVRRSGPESLDPDEFGALLKVKKRLETRASQKKSKKVSKKGGPDDSKADYEGDAPLFAIDTTPTPVDLAALKTALQRDGDEVEPNPKKETLTRQMRRRNTLIERQREIIRKKLPEAVNEKAAQLQEQFVQEELDKWTKKRDDVANKREQRKKSRKDHTKGRRPVKKSGGAKQMEGSINSSETRYSWPEQ